jgi:hypothetical protein
MCAKSNCSHFGCWRGPPWMQCTMGNCCGRRAQLLAPADEEEDEFFAVPNPRGPRYRGQGRPLGKDGNPALRSRLGSASDGRRHHAAVANGCSFASTAKGLPLPRVSGQLTWPAPVPWRGTRTFTCADAYQRWPSVEAAVVLSAGGCHCCE